MSRKKKSSKGNGFIVFDYLDPIKENYRGNSVMFCMLMCILIIISVSEH